MGSRDCRTSLAPEEDVVDLIMGLEEDIRELLGGDCDTAILLGVDCVCAYWVDLDYIID